MSIDTVELLDFLGEPGKSTIWQQVAIHPEGDFEPYKRAVTIRLPKLLRWWLNRVIHRAIERNYPGD